MLFILAYSFKEVSGSPSGEPSVAATKCSAPSYRGASEAIYVCMHAVLFEPFCPSVKVLFHHQRANPSGEPSGRRAHHGRLNHRTKERTIWKTSHLAIHPSIMRPACLYFRASRILLAGRRAGASGARRASLLRRYVGGRPKKGS